MKVKVRYYRRGDRLPEVKGRWFWLGEGEIALGLVFYDELALAISLADSRNQVRLGLSEVAHLALTSGLVEEVEVEIREGDKDV